MEAAAEELPGPKVTGNRIELEGRLLDQPEVRITPAGTPVLTLHGRLRRARRGTEARERDDGRSQGWRRKRSWSRAGRERVTGTMRALKAGLNIQRPGAAVEVVAASIEPNE